jgi:hypothetical protein
MRRMRRALVLAVLTALVLAAAPSAAPTTTAAQLTARFKAATGQKLLVNKTASYAGHYRAYDLGAPSVATRARWGTFTVYLVTAADVDADATNLLKDSRSGALGTPTAGGIYWEQGATLQGQVYWQAKRRYGQNVVVTWIGLSATKKTDASWKRLHTALTKATK